MRDVLGEIVECWRDGGQVGLATLVSTWRSAPRQPGASMLVDPEGRAVGSVSGGCVEGAVYELAQEVMTDGRPVLTRYGVSDGDALEVGLTCGGTLELFGRRAGRDRHRRRAPRRGPGRTAARGPARRRGDGRPLPRWRPWPARGRRRCAGPAGAGHTRAAHLRTRG